MLRSREDLILAVLDNLGVTAEGQTPEAEDTAKVDGKMPAILAELRALGICYVDARDGVPFEMFSALADVVAAGCRAIYGVTGDEASALMQADAMARVTLKTINSGGPTYALLVALSF